METDENAVKLTTLITSELQTLLKLRFGEVSPCSENNKFFTSLLRNSFKQSSTSSVIYRYGG